MHYKHSSVRRSWLSSLSSFASSIVRVCITIAHSTPDDRSRNAPSPRGGGSCGARAG